MFFIDILITILLSLVLYTYLVYPILLKGLSKLFGKVIKSIKISEYAPITVVISAYNEVNIIEDAINSLLNSNYPKEKIFVKVGSDGSNDGTFNLLQKLSEKYNNLKVYNYDRIGKNAVLNELCKNISTNYLFFMDADVRIRPNTLTEAMEKFGDEDLGAIICPLVSRGSNIDSESEQTENVGFKGENFYQNYECDIKVNESKIYTTSGSLGAFYGIRTKYYEPLPDRKVADDFVSLMFVAKHKKRIIFDKNIVVDEVREKDLNNQFTRRIRITAGLLASFWYGRFLLNPKYGWYSFFLLSHRILRIFAPVLISIAFILLFFSENELIRITGFISYLTILIFALIGYLFEKLKIRFSPFSISLFFVSMSFGQLIAFLKYFSYKNISIWQNDTNYSKVK